MKEDWQTEPDYPRPTYRCRNCNDNRWRVVLIPVRRVALWECVTCHHEAPRPAGDTGPCDWLTASGRLCRRKAAAGSKRCPTHRQAASESATGFRP